MRSRAGREIRYSDSRTLRSRRRCRKRNQGQPGDCRSVDSDFPGVSYLLSLRLPEFHPVALELLLFLGSGSVANHDGHFAGKLLEMWERTGTAAVPRKDGAVRE